MERGLVLVADCPNPLFPGVVCRPLSLLLEILPGDEPLVAVFDVNHKYGGAYLVPARRLYEAIHAKDISTNKSRALIFVSEGACQVGAR